MFEIGQEVTLRSKVGAIDGTEVCIVSGSHAIWLPAASLELAILPVTVRCELGCDHLLTDLPTLKARCKALGMKAWGGVSLGEFISLCAALAKKGVTAEQFVEGLT